MTLPVFIGIAVALFMAGIFFVVKGISSEELEAVPISNPEEIKELRGAFPPPKPEKPSVGGEDIGGALSEEKIPESIRVSQLEEENQRLAGQIEEQKEKCARLERHIEVLTREHRNQHDEMTAVIRQLKAQNDDLLVQMKKSDGQIAELRAELTAVQKSGEEKSKEARKAIELLKTQKLAVGKAELGALSDKLAESLAVIESLKRENKELQQANDELKNNFRKTEELNACLVEKERMLHYELTKNRAQALGLEKICEGFRAQIETMTAEAAG